MLYLKDKMIEFGRTKMSLSSFISYMIDWILYLIILLVSSLWGFTTTPKYSDFNPNDATIMHRYIPEIETFAPIWFLLIFSVILPIVLMTVFTFATVESSTKLRKLWDVHCGILALMGSVSCQLFTVILIKNFAGFPRPDFLKRCKPDYYNLPDVGTLATIEICTELSVSLINEGFRSLPSGHTSTIFTSQTVLAFFMLGKLKVFDSKGFSWKLIFSILYPLSISFFISCSRMSDNRHRIVDVLLGGVIGILFGILVFSFYFPSPCKNSKSVGRAYPPRKFEIKTYLDHTEVLKISNYDIDNGEKKYTESIDSPESLFFQMTEIRQHSMPARTNKVMHRQ